MKLFSNFDTHFLEKLIARQKQRHNEDDIIVLKRSRMYLYIRVIFHFFLYACGLIFTLGVTYYMFDEFYIYVIFPICLVWILFVWFRIFHKILKYFYDFTIITPTTIFTYKQKGFLNNNIKEFPTRLIRSIQVSRNSLLENMFHYGEIDIHVDYVEDPHIAEDNESAFVIGLTFVDEPMKAKNKITDICFEK